MTQINSTYTIKTHSLKKKELTDKIKKCFFTPKELSEEKVCGPYIYESDIDLFTLEQLKTIYSRVRQNTRVIMGTLEDNPSTEK